jgi:hypothetical protein
MRTALLAASLGLSACASRPIWYVDRVEGGHAVLVSPSGEARTVSSQELPPDAGEGSWIRGDRRAPELERQARARVEAQRRALSASDDGRSFSLER